MPYMLFFHIFLLFTFPFLICYSMSQYFLFFSYSVHLVHSIIFGYCLTNAFILICWLVVMLWVCHSMHKRPSSFIPLGKFSLVAIADGVFFIYFFSVCVCRIRNNIFLPETVLHFQGFPFTLFFFRIYSFLSFSVFLFPFHFIVWLLLKALVNIDPITSFSVLVSGKGNERCFCRTGKRISRGNEIENEI